MFRPALARLAGAIALVSILSLAGAAQTAQDTSPPATTMSFVYVPYEAQEGPKTEKEQSVLIPYAEFLKLKTAAEAEPKAPLPDPMAALASSRYTGRVMGEVVLFEVEMILDALIPKGKTLTVDLPFNGLSIESLAPLDFNASVAPAPAGAGLRLTLREGEGGTIRLRGVARLTVSGAVRSLSFGIPETAATAVTVALEAPGALVPVQDGLPAAIEKDAAGGAVLRASAGGRDAVRVSWRPDVETTGLAARTVLSVQENTRATVGERVSAVKSLLGIRVLSGACDSVRFDLPPESRLVNLSGNHVKDWRLEQDGTACVVELIRAVNDPFDLELDWEIQTPSLPAPQGGIPPFEKGTPVLTGARIADAAWRSGGVTITPDTGIDLWVEKAEGLAPAPALTASSPRTRHFTFNLTDWRLTLSRRRIPARIRATGALLYQIDKDRIRLNAHYRLTAINDGVFAVAVDVPAGYQLKEATADDLAATRQDSDRVEVSFLTAKRNQFEITLSLEADRNEGLVPLAPLRFSGAEEDTGIIGLAVPESLKINVLDSHGLESVDARELTKNPDFTPVAGQSIALGYRYTTPEYGASLSIEDQQARITCETWKLAEVQPSLMRVSATIAYNVEFTSVDEFQIRLPASVGQNIRFQNADIKEKTPSAVTGADEEDERTTWTIRLQRRVTGPYELKFSFDMPLTEGEPGEEQVVVVPYVSAAGVARETGYVAVSRGENLEVRVADAKRLERQDVKELPRSLAGAHLGFRYFNPADQALSLTLVRHEFESVLGSAVRRMHMETVLSKQREAVHEIYFEIQNNREQYLELAIPQTKALGPMEIWAAFVRGAPVQPTIRQADGARLIELGRSGAGSEAFRVRLVLRQTLPGDDMGVFGHLNFETPQPLNMPVLRMTRKFYLPTEYRYVSFGGSMRLEKGAATPWIEPAAERLLSDLPAVAAQGVQSANRTPSTQSVPVEYDTTERNDEKQARLQGAALEIPIVREGLQYHFSKLSGVGDVEIRFWKRKPLLIIQGLIALIVCVAFLFVFRKRGGPAPVFWGFVVLFVLTGLSDGMAARIVGSAWVGAAIALPIVGILCLIRYEKSKRQSTPPEPNGTAPRGRKQRTKKA